MKLTTNLILCNVVGALVVCGIAYCSQPAEPEEQGYNIAIGKNCGQTLTKLHHCILLGSNVEATTNYEFAIRVSSSRVFRMVMDKAEQQDLRKFMLDLLKEMRQCNEKKLAGTTQL